MHSYECYRNTPYSEDLRWQIVYQQMVLEYSVWQVAENLGASLL